MDNKYTLKDVGCYVDGARGIHAVEKILDIAEGHGFSFSMDAKDIPEGFALNTQEFPDEIEDGCDAYMNKHFPVEGAYWGRSEQGDWGLWAIEEEL